MDLNITASEDGQVVNVGNCVPSLNSIEGSLVPDGNLRPDLVGGQNLTSIRPNFDLDNKSVIVTSDHQLLYYSLETCEQVGKASITSNKLEPDEVIVSCEKLDSSLYIVTNHGKIYIWSMERRDWTDELRLPLNEDDTLVSCKMLSKRQYIYSILDNTTGKVILYSSMSKSERERPKRREVVGECTLGEQHTFDIGCMILQEDSHECNKSEEKRLAKQRCLTYIQGPFVFFQRIAIGEKFLESKTTERIRSMEFTCVRANDKKPMVAAGDSLGRIYLYTGDFPKHKINRTKLHWHTLPVSDICFSSTGCTMFSVGGESGCVVVWDLTQNNIGQKHVVARLGMPIRYINCSNNLNQLILSFEDNELQFMDTNNETRNLKTFTWRTIDMYKENNFRALRSNSSRRNIGSIGMLWHSITDTVVTNAKTGWLQFYSPKSQSRIYAHNFLKSNILSLEKDVRVIPSDITKASITLDGNWLAFYEIRESENSFPDVNLHIWQRSSVTNRWVWIQTAQRLHASPSIVDLKYSSDGQFLASVSEDGTFQILHRICFESKASDQSKSKQMYAKGFIGNVPEKLAAMVTFSQDSSVMAMSLKNDTTLIWMIVDSFKFVYECQLNQIDPDSNVSEDEAKPQHDVLGLHFGYHKPTQSLAPLCEVRTNSIKIWNILNPHETMEFPGADIKEDGSDEMEFTAVAFDQCPGDSRSLDHFAVTTRTNLILIFRLQIAPDTRTLRPLIAIDGSLRFSRPNNPSFYTNMCFLSDPILSMDSQCHPNGELLKLLNRLCLMNNHQELISITDKLTLDRESASNNCNEIKTYDVSELQAYFTKSASLYREEAGVASQSRLNTSFVTEKQKRMRNRLEVQKMLKDLLSRIPSQNLPQMNILGPMILDKLI